MSANRNLLDPSQRTLSRRRIEADGDAYTFYVNDRRVFSRHIDDSPRHVVVVGVTVVANDYP